jgi:hypothetical protein
MRLRPASELAAEAPCWTQPRDKPEWVVRTVAVVGVDPRGAVLKARMAVVAGAGRRFRPMGGASWAAESETAGRETHFGCWLIRLTPTAGWSELLSCGHGALGERLASTASRGRRVGRH